MGVFAKDTGGGDYTPTPEGTFVARCVQFIELGHLYNGTFGTAAHKIQLGFEVLDDTLRYKDKEGQLMYPLISREFTLSLSSKSNLRPTLESWRGKTFTPEELKGFDVTKVVGAPCMLAVVHKESGEKTYANISAIMAPPGAMVVPEATRPLLIYEIEMREGGTWNQLSEWTQKKISESTEFTAKSGQVAQDRNGQAIKTVAEDPESVNNPESPNFVPKSTLPF